MVSCKNIFGIHILDFHFFLVALCVLSTPLNDYLNHGVKKKITVDRSYICIPYFITMVHIFNTLLYTVIYVLVYTAPD